MITVLREKLLRFGLLIALISPPNISKAMSQDSLTKCLPADTKLGDVAEVVGGRYARGQASAVHKITVEDKLKELKATCNGDNKLVDGNGKQIVFTT